MRTLFSIVIFIVAIGLTGCDALQRFDVQEPVETVEDATEEPGIAITEEATEEANATEEATEEATATENLATFTDGDYLVTSDRLQVTEGVNVNPAPEGHRWLMLTATLVNDSGPEIVVAAENLAVLDEEGNRYEPGEMVERVSPALVGSILAEGESVYGFAIFAVPEGVEPNTVEWCPGGACETPLLTPANFFEF